MLKKVLMIGSVLVLALGPGLAAAAPGHSGDGGNNGNHSGSGGGGNAGGGHGGGDGGHGGGSHGGGSHGGGGGNHGGGGNNGGGGGDNGGGTAGGGGDQGGGGANVGGGTAGGGSSSPSVSAPSGGGSTGTGTYTVIGGKGISTADREKLMADVKVCEMERPGLALGNTTSNGGWSFLTADDTVWPFVYRCMAARGHQPYGADYNQTTNFGTR